MEINWKNIKKRLRKKIPTFCNRNLPYMRNVDGDQNSLHAVKKMSLAHQVLNDVFFTKYQV